MDSGDESSTQNEGTNKQDIGSDCQQLSTEEKDKIEPQENATDEAGAVTPNGKKKCRKRKRHYFNAIRGQMEFYFGDANLSKDRFLKQLIDKDPFVPLDVFLTFNKMKALTNSTEEIAKSLSNSVLLELDETHQRVRRKVPLPVERNVDEKTLYVEALPPTADHDWVRQVFERFGNVTYVSLPKYSKSRKIKEFGFVEFEQEKSVEKAIKAFAEFNGVLQLQKANPAELQSVKAFIKEQNSEDAVESEGQTKSTRKRNKADKTEEGTKEESEPKPKRLKNEVEAENTTASETAGETTSDEIEKDSKDGDETELKKKRRKKKKKTQIIEKRKKASELNIDASFYELKILPKRDWKRLRNKYLNLQREKVAELKRKLRKEQQAHEHTNDNASESLDATAPPPAKKTKPNERKLRKMNMNFYGAGDDESKTHNKEIKQNPALERTPLFSYAEGLIVEVSFLEPCVNIKEFKTDMRQYETVKYVDVKEGAMHAYLRLESSGAAEDFIRQLNCAEYKCKILSGDVELEYWKKIEQDREMKLNKKVKVPQKRGREKVKKLLTKHIRFGDDEEEQ